MPASGHRNLLDRYCVTCHNGQAKTANLVLDQTDVANPGGNAEIWERVVHKLRTGTMPPSNMPQPSSDSRRALVTWLETSLDAASAAKPNPGRTETLRRLNRTEYQNAVRDLLALDVDAASLLPPDESGHGFDNVTVGDLPPTLLDRYISAAQKISRLAIGSTQSSLQVDTIRLPADLTQEESCAGPADGHARRRVDFLHVRAGRRIRHPDLARARSERECLGVARPASARADSAARSGTGGNLHDSEAGRPATIRCSDKDLKERVTVRAGRHDIGVTFVREGSSLVETARQPLQARFNDRRHPRNGPAIDQVSVTGPYAAKGAENTPSRRRLFVCQPVAGSRQIQRGRRLRKTILSTLMRRAYRRPISKDEVERADGVLPRRTRRRRFRLRNRTSVERCAHQSGIPVPRGNGSEESRRPAVPTGSAISSSRRDCRFSCGAAFRTTNCSTRRFAAS